MNIVEIKNLDKVTEGKLLIVWENSVRATHHFLSDEESNDIKEYVPQALNGVNPSASSLRW